VGSVTGQVEVLSESQYTRVTRLRSADDRTVIRKEMLGPDREERARHELEILHRLAGVDRVVQPVAEQPDPGVIMLDDVHGEPLAHVAMPLETTRLVDLMLALASVTAAVHQHGVIHRDINPTNILLTDEGRTAHLIDFALAVTFAEIRPEFTHPKDIVGTLPYISPEQTGRTTRPVDRRADLYGLGATMYEMVTGRPPFGTGDPLRLVHDHLTRPAVPPGDVNPRVPPVLSDIIMHLLEKEPDNRYQTAEGLIHDLERVRDGIQQLQVGADDVPPRLTEPSRLVGREHEIDVLRSAFEGALAGESRGVVVGGESGVGKTALVDELRPIATGGDGWFAYGKFDRYRRDQEYDGVRQAFRALGRLLLAVPEEELAPIRERLLTTLGAGAGTSAAVVPEFATLLRIPPEPGDPLTAQSRAVWNALHILRAVASRKRPVVFVIDDVQWAGTTPLGLLDPLLSGEEEIEGLLTVVAYREGQLSDASPLAPLLSRWRAHPARPEHLSIGNLDEGTLAEMIREMLHCTVEQAAELAGPVFGLTRGNPYESVELLNGLRLEGILEPSGSTWHWNKAKLDRRLAPENVAQLTKARVDGMPPPTRQLLETMACLGGVVQLHALEVATDASAAEVQQRLAPALDDGLLVMGAGLTSARFHHDQLRDVVLADIPPDRRRTLRLFLARRLATQPELFAVAADQYLSVIDDVTDRSERHQVARLMRQAADQSMWIGESVPAERVLSVAVRLTDDPTTLRELHTTRQAALFRLGRLDEADEAYQKIIELSTGPDDRLEPARVQISSLTNRNRPQEAINLGLDLLRQLGWAVPTPETIGAEIDRELDWCRRWIDETSEADDLARPDVTDPAVLSAGALMSRIMPATFFFDQVTLAWLALSAARVWARLGPAKTLIGVVAHVPWVFIGRGQDYRAGYQLMRRLLTVGEQRGFEPDLSQVRFLYSLGLSHWFTPLEAEPEDERLAREGLLRAGDLQAASYTFCAPVYEIDIAATVDDYAAKVEAALTFAQRTGNEQAAGLFRPYQWLVAVLRGEPAAVEGTLPDRLAADPAAAVNINTARALAAAIFDDREALARYSQDAMRLRSAVEATYVVWHAHLLRAIALADQIRLSPEHSGDEAELDEIVGWMARRAADAPPNFRHMLSLVEAERAWARDDFRTAVHAFDSALREAGNRPWHRAYIAQRSAKFMLANGVDHAAWSLLLEARQAYQDWGAVAKVDQLERAYPSLEIPSDTSTAHAGRLGITAGAIDMLGILAASQALSSETSIGAVRSKVVEVLSAMTGATDVNLLVRHVDGRRWLVAASNGEGDALVPLSQTRQVPHSVIRYVERTREPLLVGDASQDDRFSRDPYFIDAKQFSILVVPVMSRGELRAILIVENRLIRNAFSVERLEAVTLVASQLAVSLDNALLYSSLEGKVEERTQQLAHANERLEQLSVTDPLTGLANRRRLEESLRDECRRAQRSRAPLTVAMVDIDGFKQYNDRYGHREGDRCLQRVATELEGNVRGTDLVARYGGEEFAVVMPDTSLEAGWETAERVRLAISEVDRQTAPDRAVTVSVGVATIRDADQETTDQLVERADSALYEAKRAGRNRVMCAPDV
jgi:diguanylate cyclase (GGDEF)-like protein